MAYKDKEKQKVAVYKHYLKNKEKCAERTRQRRAKNRQLVHDYKAGKTCHFCPENNPICFDFHHIDPSMKEDTVTYGTKHWSTKKLQEEIDKCLIVCSNCHRKLHAGFLTL